MNDFMDRVFREFKPQMIATFSAWVGGMLWGVYLVLDILSNGVRGGWIERLFLLAPLVVVPLALWVILQVSQRGKGLLYRVAVGGQPVAAVVLVAVFAVRRPSLGGLADLSALTVYFTIPWLLFCGLLLLGEGLYVWKGHIDGWTDVLIVVPVLFLQVGGFWLMMDQMGIAFMGITAPIRLLTGVHFHFTGFGLPVLFAGLHAHFLRTKRKNRAFWTVVAAVGVFVGIPMVAIGFMGADMIKTTGVILLSFATVFGAVLLFESARRIEHLLYILCLRVGAVCVVLGMVLAVVFQVTLHLGTPVLSIPVMTVTHGVLNGMGFMLGGLIGIRGGLIDHGGRS